MIQQASHTWTVHIYDRNCQFSKPLDDTLKLLPHKVTFIKQAIRIFLYCVRAVLDNTIMPALNDISTQQAHPTANIRKQMQMLLDYLTTNSNTKIRYSASDMQLHLDTNVAYLVADKAKSWISSYFYCSDKAMVPHSKPTLNAPILVKCKLLQHAITSVAEAETVALFYNCQTVINIKNMLYALGHPKSLYLSRQMIARQPHSLRK